MAEIKKQKNLRFRNLEIRRQGAIPELVPENFHATYRKHEPFNKNNVFFLKEQILPHHENNQKHLNQSPE